MTAPANATTTPSVRYLLDTNVVSEIEKGSHCDLNVADWFASISAEEAVLSVLLIVKYARGPTAYGRAIQTGPAHSKFD